MLALTVQPMTAGSARLEQVPDPPMDDGPILVRTLAIGICGTDLDILAGSYGTPPEGQTRLVLGHESLGRVVEAPANSGFSAGDLVVGIVRRPDPVPCPNCAVGEWDMCRNGKYTERGIKGRHGYCSEQYRIHPEYAVKVDPSLEETGVLLEPTSVVAKAWDHIDRIGHRASWSPRTVLVTGAGPIGLLAALLGVQRGLEVHVLDRITSGPKPGLVRDLGAEYHTGTVHEACAADITIECTGAGPLVLDVIQESPADGVVCLTGISSGARSVPVDADALGKNLVLENEVVFGSVNANRRHYEAAASALARADQGWLERLITRRVPLQQWNEALARKPDDVKAIIQLAR